MKIKTVEPAVYRIPTDQEEADGTLAWESTTMILVTAESENGDRGLGYSYAHESAAGLIRSLLAGLVCGTSVLDVGHAWQAMVDAVRNLGRPGIAAHAISAVDSALWDLKAKVLGKPLYQVLNTRRHAIPVYGSGGFTTYDDRRARQQLEGWVEQGMEQVKIKIGASWGREEEEDIRRVSVARDAIGAQTKLMLDANGGYTAKQAIRLGRRFAEEFGAIYFEEPVSSDQLAQLKMVREATPLAVAAGEYGYDIWYFRKMLSEGAVDILQADATRCLGITGWLMAADLAYAFDIPFSAHTAPALHLHPSCAAPQIDPIEYFHDHVRIESLFFEGFPALQDGQLRPDPGVAGLGLQLRQQDAEPYRIDT